MTVKKKATTKFFSTLFLRNMPKDVKDRFKSAAYARGENMLTVCIQLFKLYIQDPTCIDKIPKPLETP